MDVANPPIPIELARELKSTNIPINYPRAVNICNIDISHQFFYVEIVRAFFSVIKIVIIFRLDSVSSSLSIKCLNVLDCWTFLADQIIY
jgi:hypothetical protein